MTVLIVDDEKIIRDMLADLLDPYCEIMVARTGEQALKAANATQPPDLVLLDVIMPDMDGYEVCKRLKADPITHEIPVIFITGLTDVKEETKGFDLGAVDYIGKPISPPVVIARVRTHLRLKRQSNLIKQWAVRDGLTGIPNRRAFDEGSEREWARATRAKCPLSLVMIDVDLFKPFNDNYGHGAGDECLIKVAKAMADCIHRPGDSLARYGGEEFVAILNDTNVEGAEVMGQNFRRAVAALNIPHAHSPAADHVTISVGGATCVPTDRTTPEALLKAADKMLYEAKDGGRDRVMVSAFDLG
ncbi:diguanylate cyclase domain-containing protein [Magnetospira sp. QH-2]|uniref:diguanylate cyclase domain-containing protein n=1 Tax=Magnetospira sp. (strain QH-2) TaxID=1288970 RepID=UPI0005FA0833|nr:diguanylate cyclase [Magnetospira sp. QH-2]